MPRKFRILGQYGAEQYISYTNQGIQAQHQGMDFGQDMGMRIPMFDIKVSAQKRNVYTKVTQNELALQFFQMGFFNPQMTDQALICLDLMEFDGKDAVMQKVSQNGTMYDKLMQYMQLSLMLSQAAAPEYTEQIAMDMQSMGMQAGAMPGGGASPQVMQSDSLGGMQQKEHHVVEKARARSQGASQPGGKQ